MPRFHIRIRERHKLMLLFLLGLVGSMLLLRQTGDGLKEEILSGGQTFFIRLAQDGAGELGSGGDVRLLWSRSWLPALWIVLSFTALGTASLYLFWIYLGFAMGVLLWTVMVYGGWRGPFYFWGLVFPQYLFYVPAFLLLYVACLRWNRFFRERHRYVKKMSSGRPQVRLFLLRIFLGISLYGMGIWTECRLNPWFLKEIFIKP